MRTALLLLLVALSPPSSAQTYGTDDQALVFFDAFCCQAGGTPIDQHTPERGARWTVEGAQNDLGKPNVTSSRITFVPGSNDVAVTHGPSGERTLHTVVGEPNGHTADISLYLIERFVTRQTFTALRLRWTPTGGTLAVDAVAVTNGAVTTLIPLGALPVAGHERHVPVELHSAPVAPPSTGGEGGHLWTVHVDGVALPVATVPGHLGETRLALAAEAPPHANGGDHARVEHLVVTQPATPTTTVCPDLQGWTAESCVRQQHAVVRTHGYDQARDHLFETVWPHNTTGAAGTATYDVAGIYGGLVRSWDRASPLSPRVQMQDQALNTEHVWPRSRGAQPGASTDGAAHNDLHHLAPAYGTFNSARSNRAFGDAFDHATETQKWLRNTTTRYASSGPPTDLTTWSRVELDFLRQPDDGDGYKSLAELGRFDVRHDLRGDVARMAAYFLATYRIEAEDGDQGRAFIDATLETLLDWHQADPVDAFEVERNERIYRLQGNRNPFVLDATLLRRVLYEGPDQPHARDVWINEIHHSNDGEDAHEGVEIAGRAGTDLYGYRVWTYSGYGDGYQVDGNGTDGTPAVAFRGTIDDEGGGAPGQPGYGAVWESAQGLRGGCQGLALTDPAGVVLQFLSYGGCMFNATSGPVFDAAETATPGAGAPSHPDSLAWSTGIRGARQPNGTYRRVQQWSRLPPGHTLQLSGVGDASADFTWVGPLPASRGRLNDYQAPAAARSGAAVANAVTGWTPGDDVPLGLLAPDVDTGHDEDRAPPDSPRPASGAGTPATLAVSPPGPNPARTTTRLRITAPPGARVEAVVIDALGRTVARYDDVAGDLRLDVSSLASGIYLIRVTAASGGTASGGTATGGTAPAVPAVTHRLTVVR